MKKKMIFKCAKLDCPKAVKCWRHNLADVVGQKYFNPVISYNGDCDYYFPWTYYDNRKKTTI